MGIRGGILENVWEVRRVGWEEKRFVVPSEGKREIFRQRWVHLR